MLVRRLRNNERISKPQLLLFAIVFALIGGIIIWRSFAAPNPNLPGDLNNDNTVNVTDLSILLTNYGTTNATADINGDRLVNVIDLSTLLSHYGETYTAASSYPASYFSGPLGQNEVLPADPKGAFLAVYPGWTGSTNTDVINRTQSLQQSAGRKVDMVGLQYGGGGTYGGQTQCAYTDGDAIITWSHSNGSIPLVTWTPGRWTSNSDSVIKQIIRGDRDVCIDAIADHLKSFGYRIMVRPLHEFNFYQYHKRADGTYDYANGGTVPDPQLGGQAVSQAFQHIVNIFKARGANNIGFIWCPDEGSPSRLMDGYAYPGNSYVDWVSTDRYNAASTDWSSPLHSGWAEAWEIWNYKISGTPNYHDRFAVANGKPFFISETSSKYDSANINRKGEWYASISKAKDPTDTTRYMSNLIGVDIFDHYVTTENNNDWRIDSNQTSAMRSAGVLGGFSQESLNGWVTWAKDPRWNVGVLGGAN